MGRTRIFWFLTLLTAFMFAFVPVANAYVDPGSGSFVFQALIGGLLAIGVALKVFWARIVGFFTRKPVNDAEPSEHEA